MTITQNDIEVILAFPKYLYDIALNDLKKSDSWHKIEPQFLSALGAIEEGRIISFLDDKVEPLRQNISVEDFHNLKGLLLIEVAKKTLTEMIHSCNFDPQKMKVFVMYLVAGGTNFQSPRLLDQVTEVLLKRVKPKADMGKKYSATQSSRAKKPRSKIPSLVKELVSHYPKKCKPKDLWPHMYSKLDGDGSYEDVKEEGKKRLPRTWKYHFVDVDIGKDKTLSYGYFETLVGQARKNLSE